MAVLGDSFEPHHAEMPDGDVPLYAAVSTYLKSSLTVVAAFNIMMWGILLMYVFSRPFSRQYLLCNRAQAASKNFIDLCALRVLSGAFEAIADPAFMLITTSALSFSAGILAISLTLLAVFYTRAEQPWRVSIWYCFKFVPSNLAASLLADLYRSGLGVAAGGLLGFGIGHIQGALVSWRYEFLVVGALCLGWGVVLLLVLPNSPATCMWLTRDERLIAVARLRGNQVRCSRSCDASTRLTRSADGDREPGVQVGPSEGMGDGRQDCVLFSFSSLASGRSSRYQWLFFLLGLVANIPNGGLSNFSTLIIQGLGWVWPSSSRTETDFRLRSFNIFHTALLGVPQGALIPMLKRCALDKHFAGAFVVIWISSGAYLNSRLPKNSRINVAMCGAFDRARSSS